MKDCCGLPLQLLPAASRAANVYSLPACVKFQNSNANGSTLTCTVDSTASGDKIIVDRTQELTTWVDYCYQIRKRCVVIYGHANNHYAGHGPATVAQFINLWNAKGFPEITQPKTSLQERTLFPL